MTDKEKLEKLKKLADAMYYAANYLTTDASRLHKAMNEYHKFIIRECKEESVFKVGDRICFKHCETNTLKITKVSDNGYYCEDGTFLHFDNQYLWELAKEQEPRYPSFEESQGECHLFQDIALNG